MSIRRYGTMFITLTWLTACGQPGPLYLPGEEPPVKSKFVQDSTD